MTRRANALSRVNHDMDYRRAQAEEALERMRRDAQQFEQASRRIQQMKNAEFDPFRDLDEPEEQPVQVVKMRLELFSGVKK